MQGQLTIGLFGFGCVGQGFYEVACALPELLQIKAICVKQKSKERPIAPEKIVYDSATILDDPEIDVIVEVIDNAEDAFEIVVAALKRGKSVVSANKKMLALRLDELLDVQARSRGRLLYEAAVAGSIPIIRALETYFDTSALQSCGGIVNGSSNYILTRMQDAGLSFEAALLEAQRAGYAESDPTLDLGGFDARNKLRILVHHAFGQNLAPNKIPKFGVNTVTVHDVAWAQSQNLRIVPAAMAERKNAKLKAWVAPLLVEQTHRLAAVRSVDNIAVVEDQNGVVTQLIGKGAGGVPTGAAVLADVQALARGFRYAERNTDSIEAANDAYELDVYVRLDSPNVLQELAWQSLYYTYNAEDAPVTIGVGRIKLQDLVAYNFRRQKQMFVAFVTPELVRRLQTRQAEALAVV